MNPTTLRLSTLSIAILIMATTAMAQQSGPIPQNQRATAAKPSGVELEQDSIPKQLSRSYQHQSTTVNLDSAQLSRPHTLEITADPGTRLSGQVRLNGETIRELRGRSISIDLRPYLSGGEKIVEISGHYQPATASVRIEFAGPDTTIRQQTNGSGVLAQTLLFEID